MKTTPLTSSDLSKSVLAVPPLARTPSSALDADANRKLLSWLAAGGISSIVYGGNANLYHITMDEFAALLDFIEKAAPAEAWMLPSIGPDYGKAIAQIAILRERAFPTAMALPATFSSTPAGVATGLRRLADAYGRPLIAYIKSDGYIAPKDVEALLKDGVLCALKYAVVRTQPAKDSYLRDIVDAAGPELIVSGMGERPLVEHLTEFGIRGFTSGSACIAPRLATTLLNTLQNGDIDTTRALRDKFLPMEDLRDRYSPVRVLHEAVRLADIAETGPLTPYLANLDDASILNEIASAATALRHEDQ